MPSALPIHLLGRVLNTPLLIDAAKAAVIHSVLTSPDHVSALASQQPAAQAVSHVAAPAGTAVIEISGTLTSRPTMMGAMSGLTSYEEVGAQLQAALADDSVERVVLLIDSPGGEASGAFELADQIAEARKMKPIVAMATGIAASAGYLLGAAASEFYCSVSATVGSIGAIYLHCNRQAADQMQGVQYTEISTGKRKGDGSPHRPLDGDAYQAILSRLNHLGSLFFTRVSAWRGMSVESVEALEAATLIGEEALQAGLVDGIRTVESVVGAPTTRKGTSMRTAKRASLEAEAAPTTTEEATVPETTVPAETPQAPEAAPTTTEEATVPETTVPAETPQAKAPIDIDAIRAEGAAMERARMSAIDAQTIPGHEAMAAMAKAENWTTERFLAAQVAAERDSRLAALKAMKASGQSTTTAGQYSTQGSVTAALEDLPIDERAQAEWDSRPAIRKEHNSDFVAYRALRRQQDRVARR